MKVFISWSGERSKAVAEALRYWLPKVIQALEPWMSADDIEKGTRWRSGLASELEQSSVGIICLTRENLDSTWIHFEAGALSKQRENTYVCTFLFDLEPTDISEPLSQFQATKAQKDDVRKLMFTINSVLSDSRLAESELGEAFDVWWVKIEERLAQITTPQTDPGPVRSDRDILEEMLNLVRAQEIRATARASEADEIVLEFFEQLKRLAANPGAGINVMDAVMARLRRRATDKPRWGLMLEKAREEEERAASQEAMKSTNLP
jgi:hypothetical protein